jgi:hypothetical protein
MMPVRRFERRRVVVTRHESALATDDTGQRGANIFHARRRHVTGVTMCGEKLLASGTISGREARRRAEQEYGDRALSHMRQRKTLRNFGKVFPMEEQTLQP